MVKQSSPKRLMEVRFLQLLPVENKLCEHHHYFKTIGNVTCEWKDTTQQGPLAQLVRAFGS